MASSRNQLFERWIRFCAPPHMLDGTRDAQLRARLVVMVTSLFLVLSILLTVGHLVFGSAHSVGLVAGISATTAILLFSFRWTKSLVAYAHLGAGFWVLLSIVATGLRGGLASPATMIFAGGPVIAVFIGGRRPGLFWGGVSIAVVSGFLLLDSAGVVFHDFVPADGRAPISAVATILLTLVMLGVVVGLDAVNSASIEERDATSDRLHRAELRRVQAEAETQIARADRMASLGQLAAGVAHEVNNPLAYIVVNLSYVQEQLSQYPVDRDLIEAIDDAREGAMRVGRIVGALKTFVRRDDVVAPLVPCDVARAVDTAIELAHPHLQYRGTVVRDYESDLPAVLGDEQQLTQVFLNLLINAAQAIGEARDDAEITARVRHRDGVIAAEIIDNGEGIAADAIERVVEPFYSTKPVGVGTGLGLSVCEGIVARHSGELAIDSELGVGTRVVVTLPVAGDEVAEPAAAVVSAAPRALHILLIDDDPRVSRAICRMLPDHQIEVIDNGHEADVRLTGEATYDLVLCDLMLGDLSGVDLYERLEARNPELAGRLVFITGGACTPRAQRFIEQVANPVLVKPFTKERLLGVMTDIGSAA